MEEGTRSTLVLGQIPKKQFVVQQSSGQEIEYKQMVSSGQYVHELSDEEKEAEFNRMHDQYIQLKINRKKELIRLKKEEFGTSSSDEQDNSSQEEIGEQKTGKKMEVKKSKGKLSQKSQRLPQQNSFLVVLELKKIVSQTELVFLEKEFQIKKKILPFIRINKLSLSLGQLGAKTIRRLRVGIGNDEDLVLSSPQGSDKGRDKLMDIFLKFLRAKLDLKSLKLKEQSNVKTQQFGQLAEGALICDKIYKKSQIIGTWQQRYIVIRNDGLHSHRTIKSKETMFIPMNDIKQVQTQFQFYKEQLVFKIIYGNNTKTDFGLPLDAKLTWVQQFANLIRQ